MLLFGLNLFVLPVVQVDGPSGLDDKNKPSVSKYIPPSLRDGANKRGDSMTNPRGRDDAFAIRVSNLSESTTEGDLEVSDKPAFRELS